MELFVTFRRNRAIKLYLKKLPQLLSKDYGKSKTYTPKQVKRTIERSNLNTTFVYYGITLFSDKESFDQYHQETGEPCDYSTMRSEIADQHFEGNDDFNYSDIASVSSGYASSFVENDGGGFSDGGD